MDYHKPVMLEECLDALNIKEDGVYVDVTYGGGGHSKAILERLGKNGKLIAFDQDEDAKDNLIEDERLIFVENNFRFLKNYLRLYGIKEVDGILGDLGISSHQINVAERGFSYRFDADLDMRMDRESDFSAQNVVNEYSEQALQNLLSEYGEVRNAKTLANAIAQARNARKIRTIKDFMNAVEPKIRGNRNRYLAQVFQAIRIEVNDEMGALKAFLEQALQALKPQGRLVIMSYHSLEDRLTKNFMKKGNFGRDFIQDDYGKIYRPFKVLTKKAIEASAAELKQNPRARSAKLRVAEKAESLAKNDYSRE